MGVDWTLDQLAVLDAIERTGSFAAAARELHRVPSAISYSVRTLEELLGIALFDRSKRTAAWTPEGRRILEKARVVIAATHGLQGLADQFSGDWEAELHVIVDGALPIEPLTRCLQHFNDPSIPTRIRLDIEYQEGVTSRFESRRATLMLAIGFAGDGDADGLDLIALPPLDMVLVVSAGHALAGAENCSRDVAREHFELVVRDSSPELENTPKGSFMESRNIMYLADFYSKRVALLQGAGFGWIPQHLVVDDLSSGALVPLIIDGRQHWTYHPQLASRSGEPLGRAANHFITILLAN